MMNPSKTLSLLLCAFPALLVGCGGSNNSASGTTSGGLAAGGASTIYVVQQSSTAPAILAFPVNANGSATPSTTLTLPSGSSVEAVATDSSGQIYVGILTSASVGEVLVYPAGSSGAATPSRTIIGAAFSSTTATTFALPVTMAVGANGVLYVGSLSTSSTAPYTIAAFPSTATGAVAPMTFLSGSATRITGLKGVAADAAGNVYVSNSDGVTTSSILVFSSGATGNVAAARTITTSGYFYGLSVDSVSNIYVAQDMYSASGTATAGSIVEFAAGASGAATPIKTITGTTSAFFYGGGLKVDGVGNIYTVNAVPSGNSATISLLAYPPTASGNVAPALNFTSTAWSSGGSELALK